MSSSTSELLFVISKKDTEPTNEATTVEYIESNTAETKSFEPDVVLAMLWKNGKMGAAYYNITSKELCIYTDMIDPSPEFISGRNLLRSVNIKHIITIGSPCDNFVKFIIDYINNQSDQTIDSDQIRKVPQNLSLLPPKEFSYVACELKIFNLNLPSLKPSSTDPKNEAFFRSLIDFNNKLSVHALGALVKFVEISWDYLKDDDDTLQVKFIDINQISLEEQVYINTNTFQALQVFQKTTHDSKFKYGSDCYSREGLSIYKLFIENCKSKLGIQSLRRLLLSPLKDINEINKRLNFIEFAIQPANIGFIDGLHENIKKVADIDRILSKIQYFRSSSYDWERLSKTIYNILYIHELCAPYRSTSALFEDLNSKVTENLYGIESCIRDSIDFSYKADKYRPVIKQGVDEQLDNKKMRRQDIGKYLTAAANFTVDKLPDFLNECTIIYIPEMGHLVALKSTDRNTEQLEYLGFEFMFEVHDTFHYKNAMCKELDKHLGQLQDDIIAHEIRIMQRISSLVLQYVKDIKQPLKVISLLDCLISMAKVAKERNYVRPNLNNNNIIEIVDGRHILFELQCDNYVPNNYSSGGNNSRVKVVTGPNNCGKSLYLKQNGLLVYLAHIGSFVPAASANICIVHSIHTNMRVNESASLPLSAFIIELSQMAQILNNSRANSLVIVDEFGKGTTGQDGLALLGASLRQFLNESQCPHVLLSTHFKQLTEILLPTPLLSYLTFDFTKNNEDIVFLFKIMDGFTAVNGSFAFQAAATAGLEKTIVERAREIYDAMMRGADIKSLNPCGEVHDINYFLNVDVPPVASNLSGDVKT